jgi:hypothetical protein
MPRADNHTDAGRMAIVDTMTRLIMGEVSGFSGDDLEIAEAIRGVLPELAGSELSAVGSYLRSLGVLEMIELVEHTERFLADTAPGAIRQLAASLDGQPRQSH